MKGWKDSRVPIASAPREPRPSGNYLKTETQDALRLEQLQKGEDPAQVTHRPAPRRGSRGRSTRPSDSRANFAAAEIEEFRKHGVVIYLEPTPPPATVEVEEEFYPWSENDYTPEALAKFEASKPPRPSHQELREQRRATEQAADRAYRNRYKAKQTETPITAPLVSRLQLVPSAPTSARPQEFRLGTSHAGRLRRKQG